MCGIAGILINYPPQIKEYKAMLKNTIKKMTTALHHRGPDGEGCWINEAATIGLGHTRLAIIDLTNAAAQPMQYTAVPAIEAEANRYTITFNGEIYNYIELRNQLQKNGYYFHSQSDTEVILAAYDFWKEDCLQHFDGMFAFAIWDAKENTLFAARDRFGEKPLFYYHDDKQFVFASEMKALWAIGVEKKPDNKMLVNYIALGYVQNANDKQQTFYENINALPAAHFLLYTLKDNKSHLYPYWKLDKDNTIAITENEAIEKFDFLLQQSITKRLRADVTIGTSLSGGLDSSTIAANIYQQNNKIPFKTFSAIFPGFDKDESKYIQQVTKHLSLQNFTVSPTAQGLISHFEKLCYHQEEPFVSSSIFAQFKVFELAKQHQVKVLLDGQGADETLAGYNKYIHWYLQQLIDRKKYALAKQEKMLLRQNKFSFKWNFANYLATHLPAHAAIHLETKAFNKISQHPFLDKAFVKALHGREWEGIHKPIITKLNDILHFNTTTLGLEELLRYADRNSMANGIEVRLPFLSHELVQFIFLLPANFKIHQGYTKWLLRKVAHTKLPEDIVWRKNKIGFEPPQKLWMEQATLQEYMQAAKAVLVDNGVLQKSVLNKKIIPMNAIVNDNYDWRYLCAAQMYK